MKVLIVEDTIIKYIGIKRDLERCRSFTFSHEETLEGAKKLIEEKFKTNEMFDLIITDMNFPRYRNDMLTDAGFQLINFVNSLDLHIPIIICSTSKFQTDIDNVLGSVRYSEKADLAQEFRKLLHKIKE